MDQDRFATLIERPEVHQMILGDYEGGYSLGLTLDPENQNEPAISVSIEGEDAKNIPRQITLDGMTIPVIVETNFEIPVPLFRK